MWIKPREASSQGFRRRWLNSLEKSGFSLDEGHYPRSRGGIVAYLLLGSSTSDALTVLFHGTGNDLLFTWQGLIEMLLHQGRSVLTFDLDGHGMGSTTYFSREDFPSAADDLARFLQERQLNLRPYHMIGYSLGASLLLSGVASKAFQPSKTVLIALPRRVNISWRFAVNEFLGLVSVAFVRQWCRYGWRETFPAVGPFRRRSFPVRLRLGETKTYVQVCDAIFRDNEVLGLLPSLSHNCLGIWGGRDWLALVGEGVLWGEVRPDLERLVIDRANHFLLPFHELTVDAIKVWMVT